MFNMPFNYRIQYPIFYSFPQRNYINSNLSYISQRVVNYGIMDNVNQTAIVNQTIESKPEITIEDLI